MIEGRRLMYSQTDFEARLVATLTDFEISERYQAQDPLVVQQVRSIATFMSMLSQDIDIATIEPFIKSRDRSIIADATNKGILPISTPCQHTLEINNRSANSVTLSQGRYVEDHSNGRLWRLLQSVTIDANSTGEVVAEQSEYREIAYTIPYAETFHKMQITLNDDQYLAGILVRDDATPIANTLSIKPRWMNVAPGDYAFNLTTDSLRRIFIEFGDSDRAGRTVQTGQVFKIGLFESYGDVDVARLKDASLTDVFTTDEHRISIRFKAGGLIRQGADPLSVAQLRVLASYPSLYDENAVFLENFDYFVRQKFMARSHFISVWNENIQERHYGVTWKDINHLHLAVVAKNSAEQSNLENEIVQLIGRADSLYRDRVRVHEAIEKAFEITITGRLAAVHDLESVKAQIKGLLIDRYGKTKLSASRWLINGFNMQEMSTLLRTNITAFQDNISDFSIATQNKTHKPHEWIFVTESSIVVNLERTAEVVGAAWTLI